METRLSQIDSLAEMSVSEICRRTHLQACGSCEDLECGDNLRRAMMSRPELLEQGWPNSGVDCPE